jgi:hypothetical protein
MDHGFHGLARIKKTGECNARCRGNGSPHDSLPSSDVLRNNWNRLLDVAGLTGEERREAVRLSNVKVGKVPGTEI